MVWGEDSMRVAIVNDVGFDGGGISRLAIEYSKLGFDVYTRRRVHARQTIPHDCSRLKLYDYPEHIIKDLNKYDRVIFLPFTFNTSELDKKFSYWVSICKNLQSEICYIYCSRNLIHITALIELEKKYNFRFSRIFSINPASVKLDTNIVCMNINAYTFGGHDVCSVDDRFKVILSAGRIEAFKGTIKYIQSFNYMNDDYTYVHEGANISFNENGYSVPPQLFCLFSELKPKKILKPQYAIRNYDEMSDIDKLNIYPSYGSRRINAWSNYYAGICCTLGTISKCREQKSIFGKEYIISDKFEATNVSRQSENWNDALEYTTLEMIAVGLPVLFSRKYAELIGYNDNRVIYDSFSEIPIILDSMYRCYADICDSQYEEFRRRYDDVNANIIRIFKEEIA
jgi:glycosyltransferase involved in cell wall biosynthesis